MRVVRGTGRFSGLAPSAWGFQLVCFNPKLSGQRRCGRKYVCRGKKNNFHEIFLKSISGMKSESMIVNMKCELEIAVEEKVSNRMALGNLL